MAPQMSKIGGYKGGWDSSWKIKNRAQKGGSGGQEMEERGQGQGPLWSLEQTRALGTERLVLGPGRWRYTWEGKGAAGDTGSRGVS